LLEETNSVDEVQSFTIREIEGVIRALAQPPKNSADQEAVNKNIYDTIMNVYGARYTKEKKEKLKKKLKNYNTLKNLQPSELTLPKEFPHYFSNKNLCEVVYSVLFSLKKDIPL